LVREADLQPAFFRPDSDTVILMKKESMKNPFTGRLQPIRVLHWLLLFHLLSVPSIPAQPSDPAAFRWETDIRAFERADSLAPPPADAALFVGSSSIRMWDSLSADFPGVPVIRRGFGGSQMEDALRAVSRIIVPYRPRWIFLYEGDNDIASGKTPESVFGEFKALADTVQSRLPNARLVFISVKPSPSRRQWMDAVRALNGMIRTHCERTPGLQYLDVFTPMLGPDGRPRPGLFMPDSLHMNRAGYRLWKAAMDPVLRRP
jgi:lysophospholipase L1-like esterase